MHTQLETLSKKRTQPLWNIACNRASRGTSFYVEMSCQNVGRRFGIADDLVLPQLKRNTIGLGDNPAQFHVHYRKTTVISSNRPATLKTEFVLLDCGHLEGHRRVL